MIEVRAKNYAPTICGRIAGEGIRFLARKGARSPKGIFRVRKWKVYYMLVLLPLDMNFDGKGMTFF
jgi:hypothetical protein